MLPSAVADELDLDPDGRPGRRRRTLRDWVVDFTCFGVAVGIGLLGAHSVSNDPNTSEGLAALDQ
jgi:hypothetical protein